MLFLLINFDDENVVYLRRGLKFDKCYYKFFDVNRWELEINC